MGADVAWETDSVSSNGDACAIGVVLVFSYFTDNVGVRNFITPSLGISA